jgi:Zn-finger nucleic acid-binding protein
MKCPRCETTVLDERERDGVTIDVCPQCRGIWLDRSELERIVARAVREQVELEGKAPPPPQAPQPSAYQPPPYPPPHAAPHPPPHGPAQDRYYRDSTPPRGYYREGYPHRKKHWFETLSDIFD